jgi:hypothetical protein
VSSLPVAAAPVFSPAAGTYNASMQVTLSDSTPGAAIFYTIAGTTKQYTGAIQVNSTTTISAYATGAGYLNSGTASATYTINTTAIVYEATQIPHSGSPNARVFSWKGLPDGSGVVADGKKVGAYLRFTVNVAQPGSYDIKFGSRQYSNRAIVQLSVNGTNVGAPVDEYNAKTAGVFAEIDAGSLSFGAAGNYTFQLTAVGKNPASSGYTVDTDYFKLTPH